MSHTIRLDVDNDRVVIYATELLARIRQGGVDPEKLAVDFAETHRAQLPIGTSSDDLLAAAAAVARQRAA